MQLSSLVPDLCSHCSACGLRFHSALSNPATASLYIANPLSGAGVGALFSTHPPMAKRVERLREIDRRSGNVW